MSGEDRLIAWLRERLARLGRDYLGDDAAFLEATGEWAVSVDQQIQGTHYPADLDPLAVGRRLVAVCLSDLAACGAQPAYATLTVALPSGYPAKRLLGGVLDECHRYGLTLAGGDTASTSGAAVCTLTVFGRRHAGGRWLERGAARAGDSIWLGGNVGESALGRALIEAGAKIRSRSIDLPRSLAASAGLGRSGRRAIRRHLRPAPQIELGRALSRRSRVAAIDVSDGLALDLHRLCRASGVGAEVQLEDLPRPDHLQEWADRLGLSAEELMLGGGEDYVLLFTLPPRARRPTASCRRIGSVTAGAEMTLRTAGGKRRLEARGWDHLQRPGT